MIHPKYLMQKMVMLQIKMKRENKEAIMIMTLRMNSRLYLRMIK